MPLPRHLLRMLAFAALTAVAALPLRVAAQDRITAEPSVAARCLFFLSEFIRWPADKAPTIDRPLTVGFVGQCNIEDYFVEANQDRGDGGRRVNVVHVKSTAEVRSCHIIFVGNTGALRIAPLLSEARRRNVLSVGESDLFIRQGGMINFAWKGERIQPQVNIDALRRARLTADSRMLRSAEIVNSNGQVVGMSGPAF